MCVFRPSSDLFFNCINRAINYFKGKGKGKRGFV